MLGQALLDQLLAIAVEVVGILLEQIGLLGDLDLPLNEQVEAGAGLALAVHVLQLPPLSKAHALDDTVNSLHIEEIEARNALQDAGHFLDLLLEGYFQACHDIALLEQQ